MEDVENSLFGARVSCRQVRREKQLASYDDAFSNSTRSKGNCWETFHDQRSNTSGDSQSPKAQGIPHPLFRASGQRNSYQSEPPLDEFTRLERAFRKRLVEKGDCQQCYSIDIRCCFLTHLLFHKELLHFNRSADHHNRRWSSLVK